MERYTCSKIGRIDIVKMSITNQGNMKIQCNSYQNSNNISHRNRNNSHKVYMDLQKTTNSKSTLDKEQQKGKYPISWYQILLQSCNSMALASRQVLMGSQEINSHICDQLTYDQGMKNRQ